jgi:hypothetical protein
LTKINRFALFLRTLACYEAKESPPPGLLSDRIFNHAQHVALASLASPLFVDRFFFK